MQFQGRGKTKQKTCTSIHPRKDDKIDHHYCRHTQDKRYWSLPAANSFRSGRYSSAFSVGSCSVLVMAVNSKCFVKGKLTFWHFQLTSTVHVVS